MAAVRAIALQLCRRSIIPTETFFKYCPYIGIIATIGNIIVYFFFLRSTVTLQKGGV